MRQLGSEAGTIPGHVLQQFTNVILTPLSIPPGAYCMPVSLPATYAPVLIHIQLSQCFAFSGT